jgi:nuclear pore complex protein Nup205
LPGRQTLHVTRQLIDETIILSDMFGINEYVALDLLCVGMSHRVVKGKIILNFIKSIAEQQLQHYPDLTRGLVAVMLYYDGRKAICDSLCLLAQARRGVSWEFSSPCVSRLIAAYMDQLVANNLISNILGTISCCVK